MKVMLLKKLGSLEINPEPLTYTELPNPVPTRGEVLIRINVCGVCHTELDEIEGRLPPPHLPIVLGHQAVGRIEALGAQSSGFKPGDRVGVAWIHSACGECAFCHAGEENLCPCFKATGRDVPGGYAEKMVAPAAFVHAIPDTFDDAQAAPLLCAGAIGYRSLRLASLRNGQNLGLTGFGASAHLVLKLAKHLYPDARIFVFARNEEERGFARELGAQWTGDTSDRPPENLNAVIDTTPAWMPVVEALRNLVPGGRLVVNAIRKEEGDRGALMKLDYPSHLWMEKEIKSVANVTRFDVREFLRLAAEIPLMPEVEQYEMQDANRALRDMKAKRIRGAKVLRIA